MRIHSTGSRVSLLVTGFIAALVLAACSARSPGSPDRNDEYATASVASANAQIPRFRIRDFSVVNDQTLLIIGDDGTRYRAETIGPCVGMNFTTRLAFVNRGGFDTIDRFSSIVLPDGTRCQFQSFDKLVAPEIKALDQYEKAEEKK